MSRKNIWVEDDYTFRATNSGVDIYDTSLESVVAVVNYAAGINSIWANDVHLFMGTTNSGVWRLSTAVISGSYDVTNHMSLYKIYPDIRNYEVAYLHGAGDYLCVTSISGVDQINLTTNSGIYTTVSGAGKCYQTTSGRFYYDLLGVGLSVMYNNAANWSAPDHLYDLGDIIPAGIIINDIYVTEGTSQYTDDNVLFIATTAGVIVIEERRGNEGNSRYKYFLRDI